MPRRLSAHVQAATGGVHDAVRDHILAAVRHVMGRSGLADTTTRAVAEEAGIGAGTLYNYFDSRLELIAQAIVRIAHTRTERLARTPQVAGTGTVEENLGKFAAEMLDILDELVPLIASAFADKGLRDALRKEFEADDAMASGASAVRSYLLAERAIGRIAPDADCAAAVSVLMGICHDRAFQQYLRGDPVASTVPASDIALITRALTSSGHQGAEVRGTPE